MYRGNTPGQFNGSRLPASKDYNPAYGMSGPGQGQLRGASMPGHNVQGYQNQAFGAASPQMQYRPAQGTGTAYGDPYSFNQRKVSNDAQHPMSAVNQSYGGMSTGDMYAGGPARPPVSYAAAGTEFSMVQDSNMSMQQYQQSKAMPPGWNKQANDTNMMVYGARHPIASSMYNGSQYRASISSIQAGGRQGESAGSTIRHTMQSSNFMGGEGNLQLPINYQQQASTMPSQFQQRSATGSTSQASMYMQQQYINQPRSSNFATGQPSMQSTLQQTQGANVTGQFDDSSIMMSQQNTLQQQQAAMKQTPGYRMKVPSSSSMPQTGQQQMMGGNPMQQAMSPRHTGPLSPPLRTPVVSRSVVPSASPQLQTARTTPQYPAPQVSPHMHQQAGSMSPSARLPSYSPKQQMGPSFANQGSMTPTYKTTGTPRATVPRNEGAGRGFMSPARMMSPPPATMQAPNMTINQNTRLPITYNGDSSMQHYYNQSGRYPHSWQGTRQQVPTPQNQNLPQTPSNMPVSSQVPRPTRYGMQPQQLQQQQQSQFASRPMQMNQAGYRPMQNVPTSVNTNQQSGTVLSNPPASLNISSQSDFDSEFNLDTLLSDQSDGMGSFMQQLQDVTPSISSSSLSSAPILPSMSDASRLASNSMSLENHATNVLPTPQVSSTGTPAVVSEANSLITASPAANANSASLNTPLNVSDENKLDSGEITLDSTEQDLFKAASSLPIRFAEANLPTPANTLLNELKEPSTTFSFSQTSTSVTSSLPLQPVVSSTAQPLPVPVTSALTPSTTFPLVQSEVGRGPSVDVSTVSQTSVVGSSSSSFAMSQSLSETTSIASPSIADAVSTPSVVQASVIATSTVITSSSAQGGIASSSLPSEANELVPTATPVSVPSTQSALSFPDPLSGASVSSSSVPVVPATNVRPRIPSSMGPGTPSVMGPGPPSSMDPGAPVSGTGLGMRALSGVGPVAPANLRPGAPSSSVGPRAVASNMRPGVPAPGIGPGAPASSIGPGAPVSGPATSLSTNAYSGIPISANQASYATTVAGGPGQYQSPASANQPRLVSSVPASVSINHSALPNALQTPFSTSLPSSAMGHSTSLSGPYPTSQAVSQPGPTSVSGPYRTPVPTAPLGHLPGRPPMMGVASRGPQQNLTPGAPRMRPHDGSMIRGQAGPHYPSMHPRYQQHRAFGPHEQYGPHPQQAPGPYPSSSAHPGRLPYNQTGPHMPRGPRPDYMGPRPPYRPLLTPQQQQHLQQQLQGMKMESQQLQHQLQRVQQEEMEANPDGTIPTDQPRRSDQIRRRLMQLDHNIKQVMMQLHHPPHHAPPMQDPNQPMPPHLQSAASFDGDASATSDDGPKKKRPRKQKAGKTPKGEEESKKPGKKKKKKDGENDGEKKKKKRVKKADQVISSFPDTELIDGSTADSSQDGLTESIGGDDGDSMADENYVPTEFIDSPAKPEKTKLKKRKPVATVVKPKKKRKRGYDSSDEMNSMDTLQGTPPPSPDDSLVEKRRSGRNVKRKRYVESLDISFSGDEDEQDVQLRQSKKNTQIVELNEMNDADDVMIVDKILSHRKRKVKVKKKSVSEEDATKQSKDSDVDKPPSDAPTSETDGTAADSSKQADASTDESGPILSPTSLKNPRIRKFSMGAEQAEEEEAEENGEDEYFVKYKNYSYLHCDWKIKSEIEDKRFDQKLKRYIAKNTSKDGQLIYPELEADELFNPDFVEVDRVLDVTHNDTDDGQTAKHYLIKWCSLPYEDSTWEREDDIEKVKIDEFEIRCRYRPPRRINRPTKEAWHRLSADNSRFCNGNVLRDYQFEGINWLLFNWYNRRNCILADEMGLGKTIQSITFLQKIFDYGIHGPFLVVAPLSTIANWQREFASWTTINAIVYHGSQTSRDMIHTYEWFCRDKNLDEIEGSYKMNAVITTYEMVVLDSPHLRDVDWKCLIIDEAHRLKNHSCKLVESLRGMQLEHKVLLTGTPLQNNVEELFALLTFLQPDTFNCQQTFSLEFGNLKDNAQVEKLQELLKPMMLRRLKEDVEKSIAPKQETIIEVELTNIQKKYYRAILERNFAFLSKGTSSGNVPNLMNTMMELRKCCNHPYLIKGAEDKIMQEQKDLHEEFNPLLAMIQSSGKLVLIDKLLPRLKQGGHKVLIFSQMVRVLDILEDYLVQRSYLYERIDGCIRGNERQMAIDRFSKKGSDRFVFLLCTRAGGLGINLTAADTVIIFDSDWNPQNDLQAQARCHRIGQQKPVKVYRLITRNSYEREMFDKASLKLGLDKAVLQSISGRQDQVANQAPQLSKQEVEDLLKRGAYGAVMDDDDAGNKFCEEDIDQILDRRAHTVTLSSGEKGSTFSKASFVSGEDSADIALDDPNFWEKWAKKANLDVNRLKDNKLILSSSRNRKQTRRFGGNSDDQELFAEIGSDSDDSAEYDSDGNENTGRKGKFRSRAGGPGGGQRKGWGRRDCFRIEKCLLTFGWGRWSTYQQRGRFGSMISEAELEEMSRTVMMYCLKYYNGDDKIKFFVWDLITPAEHAEKAGIDLKSHEGLTAPVPRGRKGRRNKDDPEKIQDEQSKREWAKDVNLDVFLPDEGFKKHIQNQSNKIILRIRMLYYLRTEILSSVITAIDSGTKHDEIDFEMVDKLSDPPAQWWDSTCDKSLLIGIYKHGYEKYNLIRADTLLCFLSRVGPPDERALAAEMDVEPEADAEADPEYKPARITFDVDIGDSPAPSTPNTEPSSPASVDAGAKKKDEESKDTETNTSSKKEAASTAKEWPSISELNTRLRRIITVYQKHYKQMQQRLMNMHRRSGRNKIMDIAAGMEMKRSIPQARWTRREEGDFYRTVSTFGIERDPRTKDFTWRKFRNIARLDKKTDESLRSYYLAFRRMCEQICQWKGEPGTSDGTGVGCNEEIPNIVVEPITEERASRTLYRIRLLDKVRCDVLHHPKLKERLKLCQRSPELPIWWRKGVHDHELLIGIDRYGLTRTEVNMLTDKEFTFAEAMKDYEANPTAVQKKIHQQEREEFEGLMKAIKGDAEKEEVSTEVEIKDEKETKADEKLETSEKVPKDEKESKENDKTLSKSEEELPEDSKSAEDAKEKVKEEDVEMKEVDASEKEKAPEKSTEEPKDEKKEENVESKEEKVKEEEEKKETEQEEKKETKPEEKMETEEEKSKELEEKIEKQEEKTTEESNDVKTVEKMEVDEQKTEDNTEKETESTTSESTTTTTAPTQMSLRSKTHPTLPHDFSGFSPLSSSYMINTMTNRWPKDRILMLRVEQVCFCIISGEWPKNCQSLLPSISNQGDSTGFSSSQTSTSMTEDRGTPVASSFSNILPNASDVNLLAANEKQLQAAVAQLLASAEPPRSSSYSSRRGRKKRRTEQSLASGGNPLQFANQGLSPLDKDLQRKIEQLIGVTGNIPQASTPSGLFSPQSTRGESVTSKPPSKTSTSKTLDDAAGNSSASLLANLRELVNTETKAEQTGSSRPRSRASGFSRHHSPSPSQSRAKETSKQSSDLMKSQPQQFMPTLEQMIAMNPPLQQMLQDAMKAGIDPMTAVAAFLPLFPWLDPFQMVNPSKTDSLPQMPGQAPLPSPAEMEKLLKSMGLPPELAMMSGALPGMPTLPGKIESQKESKPRSESKPSESFTLLPTLDKSSSSLIPEKSTPAKKKGISKLDSMFGIGKSDEDSPGRSSIFSGKKSRKSKFVSPAMLPSDTRIPVHNTAEGIRLSGKDAPLNKDLADWLKDNSGFVVDYQALRQQLDEASSKKTEVTSEGSDPGNTSQANKSSDLPSSDIKPKDILDQAEMLIKNAEKLVESRPKNESSKSDSKTSEDKHAKREFTLPKPVSSPASVRAGSSATPTSSSSFKQQQLSELALLQQMNAAAGLADPATAAALFGMPPELLSNLTPEMAALLASGFLPGSGGIPPELLATFPGMKPDKPLESSRSPSRSSTPSRASPSVHRHSKNPPSDPSQLTGEERVTIVNVTTGKKLSGKQAPELQTLADYLRAYPDYVISPDWSSVLRKSKFLPKELHSRLLPPHSTSPKSSSQGSSASSNAALAAALGGLPPAAVFPGMGQGMMDPVQLMAALQQMPGQGQLDMKALAQAGLPMFPFFGGVPNPLLGAGFPGQDPTMAAMAALSQNLPSPKKDRSSSSHETTSSDRSRKTKKHSEKSSERSSSGSRSSSSMKQSNQLPFSGDPMAEAFNALQRSGGLAGMANPFLAGSGNNPLLFPPMMMGGQNVPVDMMNPEFLAAQMAAFGGLPGMEPPKPSSTPSGGNSKRDKRRGSSSSSASQKQSASARSQSRGGGDEQPMDLTQFAGSGSSSSHDRKSPEKHKH